MPGRILAGMAITQLQVSDEVAARLGTPTVETLRTRLSSRARCLECDQPLGTGPVSVVGQQVDDRALLVGAHPDCHASTWVHADETDELQLPVAGAAAAVFGMRMHPVGLPRGLGWLARLMRTVVPVMVVLPDLEWAWVRLVGPGESVNDDLAYYRDRFGMTADPEGGVPQIAGAGAWFHQGELEIQLGPHRFSAPIRDRLAVRVRGLGQVQLTLASGVDIDADTLSQGDVVAAAEQGRAAIGWVPAEAGPAPPPEPPASGRSDASGVEAGEDTGKPAGFLIDPDARARLGEVGLAEAAFSLWPEDCQTCGQPLGEETPAMCIDDFGEFITAGMHHPRCRRSEWNAGPVVQQRSDTLSFHTRIMLLPLRDDDGLAESRPLLLANPGLELVALARDEAGDRRVRLSPQYARAGLACPGDQLFLDHAIAAASAQLHAGEVSVTLHTPPAQTFTAPADDSIAARIREAGGLLLGVTHAVDPGKSPPRTT